MKSDINLPKKMRSCLTASAVLAMIIAFGLMQSRMFATGTAERGDLSPAMSQGHVDSSEDLGTVTFSSRASRFDKLRSFYLLSAQTGIIGVDPVCEATVTQGGWGRTTPISVPVLPSAKATFGGSATGYRNGSADGQQQYTDHNPVDSFTVHSIIVTDALCPDPGNSPGAHATIFGQARVTNLTTLVDLQENFQIDLDDLGEPGVGRDVYRIQLRGNFLYDSGLIVLEGGNIKIRRNK